MFQHLKRILMQAVGEPAGGGGTGAPPAQPSTPPAAAPAPAAPPAPPAAPAQGAPPAALSPDIARAVENSVNAALRRAGVIGQNGASPTNAQPTAAPTAPAQPQGVQPQDLSAILALHRTLTMTGLGQRMEETAIRRMERDIVQERPEDTRSWVESYARGFGVVQATGQPAAPAPASPAPAATTPPATQPTGAAAPAGTQQPNAVPMSNAGGPPAPREHVEDVDLTGASIADRDHLLKTKGIKWYTDTLERQLRDKRIRVR